MNFVKKLFQQQQQQQRSTSSNHRHASPASAIAAGNASGLPATTASSGQSAPVTVLSSGCGHQQQHPPQQLLLNQQTKHTHSRRRRHRRAAAQLQQERRRADGVAADDDENNLDDDDDDDEDSASEERNGNAWKSSPSSSPAKSPNRRRGRSGKTEDIRLAHADSGASEAGQDSCSVGGGGSRAGTPTNGGDVMLKVVTPSERSRTTASGQSTPTGDVITREIRVLSSRHVAQVLPNLLLGSQEIANDLRGLRHYNVTHVLNVTVEVPDRFPDQFVYKRIAISDMPSAKLVPHFDEAFRFIDTARSARIGGCVLVHCYYGNSRSASVVIGYLMAAERMRYVDALRYLQLLRPGVRPNDGFQRQLKHYESTTVKRLRQQSAAAAAANAASDDGSVASGNR